MLRADPDDNPWRAADDPRLRMSQRGRQDSPRQRADARHGWWRRRGRRGLLGVGAMLLIAALALAGAAAANSPTVTIYSAGLSGGSGPNGIALGPDGAMSFTEYDGDKIGRIGAGGAIVEDPPGGSTQLAAGADPAGIVSGPDGAVLQRIPIWRQRGDGELDPGPGSSSASTPPRRRAASPTGSRSAATAVSGSPSRVRSARSAGSTRRRTPSSSTTSWSRPTPSTAPPRSSRGPTERCGSRCSVPAGSHAWIRTPPRPERTRG